MLKARPFPAMLRSSAWLRQRQASNAAKRPRSIAPARSLYAARVKIYPKRAHGTFRTIKWIVMAVTLSIYYLVPWIRWDRGPYLPNQAVLIDFPSRRFFFFFLEIWPQEFYYITGLLVLAALALFLVTTIAGRMWCGYTCPQTVWTDLMIAVERFFQGDRNARMRLDKSPWSFETLWRKGATHLSWLLIAIATGGAWVFYFADAPTLARQFLDFDAPMLAYVFVGLFTATTYLLGGIAREQVCIYMCPWPRIQGGMIDHDSLLISYRDWRGEPRGAHKAGQSWEGKGDCIDCRQCVAVCPTGIDIRNGSQLECIQCGLCIDACDEVMDKVGRPRGLVAYDTIRNLESVGPEILPVHWLRPRVILYATLMAIVGVIMLTALMLRPELEVSVLHDRNPIYVRLSDGGLRNGYTVKILNKLYEPRSFKISLTGLPGAKLSIIGHEHRRRSAGDGRARRAPVGAPLCRPRQERRRRSAGSDAEVLLHRLGQRERYPNRAWRQLPGTRGMTGEGWFAKEIDGRHVLLVLSVFFGVMFIVNGIFVYFALETFSGGDTSDPYRKGLHYNDTLGADERQAERGWRTDVVYDGKAGQLRVSLARQSGGAAVGAACRRAAQPAGDEQGRPPSPPEGGVARGLCRRCRACSWALGDRHGLARGG